MVHFSTNYATIEEADDGDDHSIAVLSIMFEVSFILIISSLTIEQ